jgi:DNA-binding SARP family transcriptional activator
VDIQVLGPVSLCGGGRTERLGPQLARLVAALVCARGGAVSSERLVALLWDGAPGDPRGRQATLRSHVSHLRRLLAADGDVEPPFVTRTADRGSSGYVLTTPPGRLDARRFEALVEAGRAAARHGDVTGARARYTQALALWRGTPFGELHRHPFLRAESRRLLELRHAAGLDLLEARLGCGEHAALLDELAALVAARPRLVAPRRMLATALARAGRPDDAVATCRAGLALLASDGVVSPVLEGLVQDLLTAPPAPEEGGAALLQ